jgi:hypothetical protein
MITLKCKLIERKQKYADARFFYGHNLKIKIQKSTRNQSQA